MKRGRKAAAPQTNKAKNQEIEGGRRAAHSPGSFRAHHVHHVAPQGHARVRQTWVDEQQPLVSDQQDAMKKRPFHCISCCTGESSPIDGNDEILAQGEVEVSGGRVAPVEEVRPGFGDSPRRWLACCPDHGGKLFWMHEQTRETT